MTRRARHRYGVATAALAVLLAGTSLAADASAPAVAARPTLAQLVGQRLVVSFHGLSADAALLGRIRAGQIGGVILFAENIGDSAQLGALTAQLQAAAREGGQPPLLVATDQEGGLVRRLPWAPPKPSAQELGTTGTRHIHRVGRRAGTALLSAGVNLDLAPVADVPRKAANFLATAHRTFATTPEAVAADATAFGAGLEAGGVLPALKHFPGLGRAGATSTDDGLVRIGAGRRKLGRDLLPYQVALAGSASPVVMLSTAVYPAYSPRAAAWSPAIAGKLLRGELGFRGVTITDSLTSAAAVRGTSPSSLALRSARAGVDMLLVTGSESTSQKAFDALLAEARSGAISHTSLEASYARIIELKSRI